MSTAQLTGPQLEVIALLAEGLGLNEIAEKTGHDQRDINRLIWAACLETGTRDRTHLVATAYRTGLLRVPVVDVEIIELREQVTQIQAARQQATEDLRSEKQRVNGYRSRLQRVEEERDRALERAEEAERHRGTRSAPAPPAVGGDPAAVDAVTWCLDKLGALARQARDGAAYGNGVPQLVDRANTLTAAANVIDQAWQRKLAAQKGARRAQNR